MTLLKEGGFMVDMPLGVGIIGQLRERARVRMESVGYLHYGSGMAGRALDFDGDLELKQAWPLQVRD
jgi:hypothetical protein